jgi:3-(3-hydroxy-phenyl)propionate hydroxylase
LEQVLREGVARHANVDVRLQHEVTQLTPDDEGVTLAVSDLQCGVQSTVRARYVVGCDGARSLVRKALNARMIDLGLHQPWLVFDVLLKPDAPALPDHTVQHCDPARPMTYCNVVGNRRRWEIMLMPGDDPAELVKPETLWRLVSRWIRPEHADIERAVIYTFHSVIAEGWRKGRLLLAGDAAHQTPPFLGQGMCAAIRDVANLVWKLDAVLRVEAPASLLDTYESERSPHVRAFIELAVRLGDIIQATDPDKARERDERFREGGPEIFAFPSPKLGPGVLTGESSVVGQPFPQPQLTDGRWLDELVGDQFAVVARDALLSEVSAVRRQAWTAAGVVSLACDAAFAPWFDQHGVNAVLLRPDRYVMGTADSAVALDALTTALPC